MRGNTYSKNKIKHCVNLDSITFIRFPWKETAHSNEKKERLMMQWSIMVD